MKVQRGQDGGQQERVPLPPRGRSRVLGVAGTHGSVQSVGRETLRGRMVAGQEECPLYPRRPSGALRRALCTWRPLGSVRGENTGGQTAHGEGTPTPAFQLWGGRDAGPGQGTVGQPRSPPWPAHVPAELSCVS